MDLIKFLTSKLFLKNLLIAIILIIVIVAGVFIGLRIYTDHGESIALPNLEGMTLGEAKELLKEENLHIEVNDSLYVNNKPRGTVLSHYPPPHFHVKEERTIFLTMNAVNPEQVIMPNVTGVSFRQAKAMLEATGLNVGEKIYKPDIAKNYVIDQLYEQNPISPGDSIMKGSEIDLILGNGLSDVNTKVPDLIGLDLEKLEQKVNESYLNLGAVVYDNTVENMEDSLNAKVYKQRPAYTHKNTIPMGSYVDVFLTADSLKVPVELNENKSIE
jgi:beta-lactam-binding protein with PASTA domain